MTANDQPSGRDTLLMVLAIVLIGALGGGALWLGSKRPPPVNRAGMGPCINNLRQLDGAKEQWALENKQQAGAAPPLTEIVTYLKGNLLPVCPGGGSYTIGKVGEPPKCSIPGHTL